MTGVVVAGAGSALELYAAALGASGRQVFVCDLDEGRALTASRNYGFQHIDAAVHRFPAGAAVLNLTPPGVHGRTSIEFLERGHPVYCEKPAAHDAAQLGRIHDLMLGGARFAVAPDTHLGRPAARAARIVRMGELGPATAVRGIYRTPGHATWHPRPWIFYGTGGGVCLDIAPYFLRAIEAIFGNVTLRAVKITSRRRPDLMPPGTAAVPVPARAEIAVSAGAGLVAELDLAFDAAAAGSQLRITFRDGELIFDPVDGGSPLTLRQPGGSIELVPRGDDRRGVGMNRFLMRHPADRWFGPGNAANVEREQRMLLAMDRGEAR